MPTAPVLTINQATLGAGTANRARADLVPNQLVTVTAADSGASTYAFSIVSVTPTTDSVPTVTLSATRTWTWTPPADAYGRSYRLRLVTDAGTDAEQTQELVASITTASHQLRIPAPNEDADPDVIATTATESANILASDFNAGDNAWGWHPAVDALYRAADGMLGVLPARHDVVGTTEELVFATLLQPGTYRLWAYVGGAGAGETASARLRNSVGTLLATAGGVAGVLTARTSSSFTVTAHNTLVQLYLVAGGAAETAFLRGCMLQRRA